MNKIQFAHDILPCPRLHLRWEKSIDPAHDYICHYELVLPIEAWDCRTNKFWEGLTVEVERKGVLEQVLFLGETKATGSKPIDVYQEVRKPIRDGAHASWDSYFTGIPIWATFEDAMTQYPSKPPSSEEGLLPCRKPTDDT